MIRETVSKSTSKTHRPLHVLTSGTHVGREVSRAVQSARDDERLHVYALVDADFLNVLNAVIMNTRFDTRSHDRDIKVQVPP